MTAVDTSAWIEFTRGTGSRAHLALRALVEQGAEIAVPDAVRMEVLAGARDAAQLAALHSLLARFTHVPASSPHDHDAAADLYRRARATGRTVRSVVDCLVAAVAIRLDVPLLAQDHDFEVLAAVSPLRLA